MCTTEYKQAPYLKLRLNFYVQRTSGIKQNSWFTYWCPQRISHGRDSHNMFFSMSIFTAWNKSFQETLSQAGFKLSAAG